MAEVEQSSEQGWAYEGVGVVKVAFTMGGNTVPPRGRRSGIDVEL